MEGLQRSGCRFLYAIGDGVNGDALPLRAASRLSWLEFSWNSGLALFWLEGVGKEPLRDLWLREGFFRGTRGGTSIRSSFTRLNVGIISGEADRFRSTTSVSPVMRLCMPAMPRPSISDEGSVGVDFDLESGVIPSSNEDDDLTFPKGLIMSSASLSSILSGVAPLFSIAFIHVSMRAREELPSAVMQMLML